MSFTSSSQRTPAMKTMGERGRYFNPGTVRNDEILAVLDQAY